MIVDNRIIWVVREQRSLGTWYLHRLKSHLNRESYFFEQNPFYKHRLELKTQIFLDRKQSNKDYKLILNTHCFQALKSLSNYTDPIVIRVSRKNRFEQFLSLVLAQKSRVYNVFNNQDVSSYPKIEPFVIPTKVIYEYLHLVRIDTQLWEEYSKPYCNETVCYEQLIEGFTSNIIDGVVDWKTVDTEGDNLTLKLPYDKKELIKNYDFIKDKFDQEFGEVAQTVRAMDS